MILMPQLRAALLHSDVKSPQVAQAMFAVLRSIADTVKDQHPKPVPAETFRQGLALAVGTAQGTDVLLDSLDKDQYVVWNRDTDTLTVGRRLFPTTIQEYELENA